MRRSRTQSYDSDELPLSDDLTEGQILSEQDCNLPAEEIPGFTYSNRSYWCDLCGKFFPEGNYAWEHYKENHADDNDVYRCQRCPLEFSHAYELDEHERQHIKEDEERRGYVARLLDRAKLSTEKFICGTCKRSFESKKLFTEHRAAKQCHIFHLPKRNSISEVPKVPGSPPPKSPPYNGKLHRQSHGKHSMPSRHKSSALSKSSRQSKRFQCENCALDFASANAYASHRKTCHVIFKVKTTDDVDVTGKTTGDVNTKSPTESKPLPTSPLKVVKPFACLKCGGTFHRMFDLCSHQRVHSTNLFSMYSCDMCNIAFERVLQLSNHRRSCGKPKLEQPRLQISDDKLKSEKSSCTTIPTEILTHKCKECGDMFSEKSDFRDHRYVCKYRPGSRDTTEKTGSRDPTEKTSSCHNKEKSGSRDTTEKTGSCHNKEKSGSRDTTEKTGSCHNKEKSGSRDSTEKTGSRDPTEKTGSCHNKEKSGSRDTMEKTDSRDTKEKISSRDNTEKKRHKKSKSGKLVKRSPSEEMNEKLKNAGLLATVSIAPPASETETIVHIINTGASLKELPMTISSAEVPISSATAGSTGAKKESGGKNNKPKKEKEKQKHRSRSHSEGPVKVGSIPVAPPKQTSVKQDGIVTVTKSGEQCVVPLANEMDTKKTTVKKDIQKSCERMEVKRSAEEKEAMKSAEKKDAKKAADKKDIKKVDEKKDTKTSDVKKDAKRSAEEEGVKTKPVSLKRTLSVDSALVPCKKNKMTNEKSNGKKRKHSESVGNLKMEEKLPPPKEKPQAKAAEPLHNDNKHHCAICRRGFKLPQYLRNHERRSSCADKNKPAAPSTEPCASDWDSMPLDQRLSTRVESVVPKSDVKRVDVLEQTSEKVVSSSTSTTILPCHKIDELPAEAATSSEDAATALKKNAMSLDITITGTTGRGGRRPRRIVKKKCYSDEITGDILDYDIDGIVDRLVSMDNADVGVSSPTVSHATPSTDSERRPQRVIKKPSLDYCDITESSKDSKTVVNQATAEKGRQSKEKTTRTPTPTPSSTVEVLKTVKKSLTAEKDQCLSKPANVAKSALADSSVSTPAKLLFSIDSSDTSRIVYRCDSCGSSFNARSRIVRHVKIHQPPAYPCTHCDSKYYERYQLVQHLRNKHDLLK